MTSRVGECAGATGKARWTVAPLVQESQRERPFSFSALPGPDRDASA